MRTGERRSVPVRVCSPSQGSFWAKAGEMPLFGEQHALMRIRIPVECPSPVAATAPAAVCIRIRSAVGWRTRSAVLHFCTGNCAAKASCCLTLVIVGGRNCTAELRIKCERRGARTAGSMAWMAGTQGFPGVPLQSRRSHIQASPVTAAQVQSSRTVSRTVQFAAIRGPFAASCSHGAVSVQSEATFSSRPPRSNVHQGCVQRWSPHHATMSYFLPSLDW